MKSFLYFQRGGPQIFSREHLKGTPIESTLADVHRLMSRATLNGPEDCGAGVVFCPQCDEMTIGFFPDKQTWQKIPGQESLWVGFFNDAIPGETDLQRDLMLGGHKVRLGDEETEWLIPAARRFSFKTENDIPEWFIALPCVDKLTSDGTWLPTEPRKKYAAVWQIACAYWDIYCGSITPQYDQLRNMAVVALQCNYRVGPVECSMLGIIDRTSCTDILQALCDIPAFSEYAKKKIQRDSLNSPRG